MPSGKHSNHKAATPKKAGVKGKKTKKGDVNPVTEARRTLISDLYFLQGKTANEIKFLFDTQKALIPYWIRDAEGNPQNSPDISTLRNDIRHLKDRMRDTQVFNVSARVGQMDAQLQMVKAKAAASGDWNAYLSGLNFEMKLHGLEAPKNVNLIADAVRAKLEQALARVSATFKDDPVLHNKIIRALMADEQEMTLDAEPQQKSLTN